ncbi:hypothetical protein EYB26_003966 [Talaromyces marneffei]|uniref:uncharacterized protein n=1 Tax=Talaromyces marneffei TaxID=37727 RepID=UPI0012A78076|nr:uncharacterized protein EYB26_003966 [Talaromyces marneffei]QGA16299.1 hypothetical protein EYB26_003966 [Talaromyces marneffei]
MAERLAELLATLMMDPKYSDLTLECDGETFAVHKAIVLTQSVVLEKACQAHWKEGKDNVIQITEFDVRTVRRMVEFLYTGDYDQDKPEFVTPTVDEQPLEAEDSDSNEDAFSTLFRRSGSPAFDLQSLEAGVYDTGVSAYQSPSRLEEIMREWAPDDETAANTFIDTFSPQICVHAIAEYYMMNDLKEKVVEKIKALLKRTIWSTKGFMAVAKEVFETTVPPPSTTTDSGHDQQQPQQQQYEGETLREVVLSAAFDHFTDMIQAKDFALMDLNSEFAALLLQKVSNSCDSVRAELKHQENDNRERRLIDYRCISELTNKVNHLRAQNTELEKCIKQIHELTTCRFCHSRFNVDVLELPLSHESNNNQNYDGDVDVGDDDGSIWLSEGQVKKYEVRCKRCHLRGINLWDSDGDDSGLLFGFDDDGSQGAHLEDLFGDEW